MHIRAGNVQRTIGTRRRTWKVKRERKDTKVGERKGDRYLEEERCNSLHLRDSTWMLLAPFDDRKLLIGRASVHAERRF